MSAGSESFMRRAVELSARGFPAPNPHVGCVIVREGEVVGEGWHDFAGGPHAEAMALAIAGPRARGADLYCTLEPCNHQGRTPPCAPAIVAAGVSRASMALRDPNPRAAGGLQALEQAGLLCETGLLAGEARAANEVFMTAMERKRPYVVIKAATTQDGFIARLDGTSQWITGEEARAAGHRLRADMGCVLVGRKTVEKDDPSLTARFQGVVNQPLRAVLDPGARLAQSHRMFCDGGDTVRFVHKGSAGWEIDTEIESREDGLDLGAVLRALFEQGMVGVLVEGGGETIGAFLRQGLVDRIEKFTAPVKFGEGRSWLGSDPPTFKAIKVREERLGQDLHETFRVEGT